MPENLNDTPATLKENQEYLNDPQAPVGKPYSMRQQASNQAAQGRSMLYKEGQEAGRVFESHEIDDALADGWSDTPWTHPNNPDHVHPEKAQAAPEPPAAQPNQVRQTLGKRRG